MAYIKLLTAATATNSPPTAATDGVSRKHRTDPSPNGIGEADLCTILVASTAGSGVMTVTLRLWGYSDLTSSWHPIGANSTGANRGIINQGAAIPEIASDKIAHAELVQGLAAFSRFYAEVTAIGGTSTAVSVWLVDTGVRA